MPARFGWKGPVKMKELEPVFNKALDWMRYAPNCWILWTTTPAEDWVGRLKPYLVVALLVGVVLMTAAPAGAQGAGSGTFTGYEDAPVATIYNGNPGHKNMCAEFTPTTTAPLVETLSLVGTWEARPGTGSAVFTDSSTAYDARLTVKLRKSLK